MDEVHSGTVDGSSAGAAELGNTLDVVDTLVHLGMLTGINEAGIAAIRGASAADTLRIRLALEAVLGGTLGQRIHEVIGHTVTPPGERTEGGDVLGEEGFLDVHSPPVAEEAG